MATKKPKQPSKKMSKEQDSLTQKYLSAPNEKLKKFYADMLRAKGWPVPKL